ncbi:MAG: hypothetical protein AAGF90_14495 [Pseudomonadota bacterium]
MFDFEGDSATLLAGAAIVGACIVAGAVVGAVYVGEIGAAIGGVAGAFVGGGVLYAIARAFDAAIRNFAYAAPIILIAAAAVWAYLEFS